MRPTLKDVAKEAKVSVATISKIINKKKGGYSEETKATVLRIIQEKGYEINAIARGLATKKTRILGVLLPNMETGVFSKVLDGIEEIAHKNNYSVVVCNTGHNGVRTLEYLKTLSANQVAGIIYGSSSFFDECFEVIEKSQIPCILALTISYKFEIPYVKVDDRQAAYSAVKYLIEKGHQKIAMIGGNNDIITGIPRAEGYKQALSDYGLPFNDKLFITGENYSYETGERCMEWLLEQGQEFTAIFAASDDLAIGALNLAHRKGIQIPEQLSIIGYDNTKASEMSFPHLTTVSQPLREMGRKAAEKLLTIISTGEKVEPSIMRHEIM
jgi:LacI family transcriptional regulator